GRPRDPHRAGERRRLRLGEPGSPEAAAQVDVVHAEGASRPRLRLPVMNLLPLSRSALSAAAVPVAAVSTSDLSRPTPCGTWDLSSLISHMIAHNRGWTASALGGPAGAEVWDSVAYSDSFDASASEVSAAFESCALERLDVYGYGSIPLSTAL